VSKVGIIGHIKLIDNWSMVAISYCQIAMNDLLLQ